MSILIDANTEYIDITDNSKWTWTPVTQARGLSVYWYPTTLPASENQVHPILWINNSSGNKALFAIVYNGGMLRQVVLICNSEMTVIGYIYGGISPSINNWYHLVFNPDSATTSSLYFNGSVITTYYSSWDDTTQIDPTSIRISNGTGVNGAMRLAHLSFFNRVLTSGEVTTLKADPMAAIRTSLANDLIAAFPLNEGEGIKVVDYSATPTEGTLTNSPSWATDPNFGMGILPPRYPIRHLLIR